MSGEGSFCADQYPDTVKSVGKDTAKAFSVVATEKDQLGRDDRLAQILPERYPEEEFHFLSPFIMLIGAKTSLSGSEDDSDEVVGRIIAESFPVSYPICELFKSASNKISRSERYGLTAGLNEKVKSTLLKLLERNKSPVPRKLILVLVGQEVNGDEKTAVETVLSAYKELMDARWDATSLAGILNDQDELEAEGFELDDLADRLAESYDKLDILGSDGADASAARILSGLGFTKDMLQCQTKFLDGPSRGRISLAQVLFLQPNLHTDQLDVPAFLSIKDCLRTWKKTLAIVSDDQNFLRVVRDVIM